MAAPPLLAVLERSRALGFLGPGPVGDHVAHAQGFVAELEGVRGRVVDLGAGGGAPGLIVATARPDLELVLVEAMGKRAAFLREAVVELGLSAEVVEDRAEAVGRSPLRGTCAAVLARSFGPPATTAECAAPLLTTGGVLLVSEPPAAVPGRWPEAELDELGLAPSRVSSEPRLQVLTQIRPCPDRFPRRNGVPAKRPLF